MADGSSSEKKDSCFYDTRTWTRSHRILSGYYAGHAFSSDSRIFDCEDGTGAILLAEADTGRELARLEQSDSVRSGWMDFSPDGSKLLVTWNDKPYISIWDLAELRRRLAQMGLDWDAPPIEPTTPPLARLAPIPPPFVVDKGDLEDWTKTLQSGTREEQLAICERRLRAYPDDADIRRFRSRLLANAGRAAEALADIEAALAQYPEDPRFLSTRAMVLAKLNRHAEATRDLDRALELTPQLANELNTQAWQAVTGPERTRNVEWGLALARKAVAAKPSDPVFINTLGVSYYRAGKYDDAVKTLAANVPNHSEYAGFDQVFLAMSYHKLGRSEEARQALKAALDWRSNQESLRANMDAEFQAFRAEAEALLECEPSVQNHKP
jgi:Flp pilus assembly protein TadD